MKNQIDYKLIKWLFCIHKKLVPSTILIINYKLQKKNLKNVYLQEKLFD